MAKVILEVGQETGIEKVYSNHLLVLVKSTTGAGETVAIQMADKNDDLTATSGVWFDAPNASALAAGTIIKIETSKGFSVRAKSSLDSNQQAVVVADILNEPTENIKGSLG